MARRTSTAVRPPELPGQMNVFDIINREPEPTPVTPRDAVLKPFTLDGLTTLEPFRTDVWIECRGYTDFFALFRATITTIGEDITTHRRYYHFRYTYTNGKSYTHKRVDEFYGRNWRVWPAEPTEEQRQKTQWRDDNDAQISEESAE